LQAVGRREREGFNCRTAMPSLDTSLTPDVSGHG
jgi:hypothetical protein